MLLLASTLECAQNGTKTKVTMGILQVGCIIYFGMLPQLQPRLPTSQSLLIQDHLEKIYQMGTRQAESMIREYSHSQKWHTKCYKEQTLLATSTMAMKQMILLHGQYSKMLIISSKLRCAEMIMTCYIMYNVTQYLKVLVLIQQAYT